MKKDYFDFDIRRTPLLKVLLPYILGIYLGLIGYRNLDYIQILLLSGAFFLIYLVSYFFAARSVYLNQMHTIALFLFVLFFGIVNSLRNQSYDNYLLLQYPHLDSIKAYVEKEEKENTKYQRYVMRVFEGKHQGEAVKLNSRIYVNIEKDSSVRQSHSYGDVITFKPTLRKLTPSYNPGQFDYKKYSDLKGIYLQQFLKPDTYSVLPAKEGHLIIHLAEKSRKRIIQLYKDHLGDGGAFQISTALILGYRGEISKETFDLFSNTGTIHILSVSGMHVGMVFAIVLFVLSPLSTPSRLILSLLLIWAYVIFTGMSPSVLRAGTMISVYIVGRLTYRQNVSGNTLFLTAFLLLLIQPRMLFEVGFQLSFLAVGGILLLYPMLRKMFYPTSKVGRILIDVIYMSIAAQAFTAPLTIYYFQQFPNLFWLANFIVVLPASFLMALGLLLPLLPFGALQWLCGKIMTYICNAMLSGLGFLDRIPFSVTKDIYFSFSMMVLIFLFIVALVLILNSNRRPFYRLAGVLLFLISGLHAIEGFGKYTYDEIRFYNVNQHIAISCIHSGKAILLTDSHVMNENTLNYNVLPHLKKYVEQKNIKMIPLERKNIDVDLNNINILIHQSSVYPDLEVNPYDMILIRNNSIRDFDIFSQIQANGKNPVFIFDGSNSDIYIGRASRQLDLTHHTYYVLKNNFSYVWVEEV